MLKMHKIASISPSGFLVTVSYSHVKNCFMCLSENCIKSSSLCKGHYVFKVKYETKHIYVSAYSDHSAPSWDCEDVMKINGKFALSLGLKDKEKVWIEPVTTCSPVERVHLEPLNSDDWEVMQLNAGVIEEKLLTQIRVVGKNQVFPIWVNNVSFFAKVAQLIPDVEPALLAEQTLVEIAGKSRHTIIPSNLSNSSSKLGQKAYRQFEQLRKRRRSKNPEKNPDSSLGSNVSEESEPYSGDSSGSQSTLLSSGAGFSLFRYFMKPTSPNETTNSDTEKSTSVDDFHPLNFNFLLRVISVSKGKKRSKLPLVLQASTVFISARTFSAHCQSDAIPSCFVARISKLPSPQQKKDLAENESQNAKSSESKEKKTESSSDVEKMKQIFSSICVNVIVLSSSEEEFEVPESLFQSVDSIAVPLELKKRLGAEVCSIVQCQGVEISPCTLNEICLYPLEKLSTVVNEKLVVEEFQKWLRGVNLEEISVVLSDGVVVKLPVNEKGKSVNFAIVWHEEQDNGYPLTPNLDIHPPVSRYGFMNEARLEKLKIRIGSYSSHLRKSVWLHGSSNAKVENLYQSISHSGLEALGGVKEITQTAMRDLEMWLKLRPMYAFATVPYFKVFGTLLVYGPKGVGKSAFLQAICKNLINYPHFVHTGFVKCLPLRGKRVDTIARKWEVYFSESVHRQPSLLVFDDLDQLASSTMTVEEEGSPDGIYYMNVAQIFIGLLKKIISNNHKIVVVASSKSLHSLHPSLTKIKGSRIFQTMLEMKLPDRKQRVEILKSLISNKPHLSPDCLTSLPWREIAMKTEGAVAQDIVILLDRAIHAALVRAKYEQSSSHVSKVLLIKSDFDVSFRGYTPSNLRGLQLQKKTNKTWKDIGGLQEVKSVIQQILTWPHKYRLLYKNYSLKPQRNILLYGAPGTGKTLLASIVANECDMNFISIKGPELLSKYIGASEQSVRDLFNRAMVAKPCILFFDEFDALVPRRGHDSTGVTDRVVNQFLTQMDGVESLEGVYVLAATSRPELIDPALLRPGRMDKCLHCPMPNEQDRFEILLALSKKLSLSEDVDWKAISTLTENYSGADLQALLYSAQVKAFHDYGKKKMTKAHKAVDVDYSKIMEKVTYMPSVEKGATSPSDVESKRIVEELHVFLNDFDDKKSDTRSRTYSNISACIEQKHLIEAMSEMKPSVSEEEKLFYQRTFEMFNQKQAEPVLDRDVKRVTLA